MKNQNTNVKENVVVNNEVATERIDSVDEVITPEDLLENLDPFGNDDLDERESEDSEVIAKLPIYRRVVKGVKTQSGNAVYNYLCIGIDHGREIKANFDAKDTGGYSLLDLIYSLVKVPVLIVKKQYIVNEKRQKTEYNTYEVEYVDIDGYRYYCPVKPSRTSDKVFLELIIKNLK